MIVGNELSKKTIASNRYGRVIKITKKEYQKTRIKS